MKNLTPDQKQAVEAKIREAVPESKSCGKCGGCWKSECPYPRPLNLQDVLIALRKCLRKDIHLQSSDQFIYINDPFKQGIPGDKFYDLTKDYHHQSEEFYSFLHSLLWNE